jgi:uncharacterized membrane protein YuzA (DUF378 family)
MDEIINYVAWLLAAIGAINWGAEEALDINLVTDTLGLAASSAGIAYLVIGIAGIVNLYVLVEEVL